MPIYEYQCPKCKNKFELMRPFSKSSEPADCPACGKKAGRVMSACVSFSTGEGGVSKQVGGSSCSTCGGGSCGSCGH
jgi:putative FmdB family regulatory protein